MPWPDATPRLSTSWDPETGYTITMAPQGITARAMRPEQYDAAVAAAGDRAVIHTATAADGAFDTGDIPAGASASVTFNSAGSFTYNCSPHPWMIGQIVVN